MHSRFCRWPLAALAALAPLTAGQAALDFTPRFATIKADGLPVRSLYLQNGPLRAFMRAPSAWEINGGAGGLVMINLKLPNSRVDFRTSTVHLPEQITEDWIKTMSPAVVRTAPAGSTNAKLVAAKANAMAVNGWRSFEFTLAYEAFGVRYMRSILLLTLRSKESVELVSVAREQDFGTVRQAGVSLLESWMEPPEKVAQRMMQP